MVPVLIATGDSNIRAQLQNAFKKARLTNPVRWVQTGQELCEALWGGAASRPALIFMTRELPGGEPREILLRLRGDRALSGVVVVLISPTALSREQLLKINADASLVPPVSMAAVREALSGTGRFSYALVRT